MESGGTEHNHHRTEDPGTFDCHFNPGTVFITIGSLWTYNALFRYHVALRQAVLRGSDTKKLSYKNMLFSKYHSGWAHAVPVEAFVVIIGWIGFNIGAIDTYNRGLPLILVVHHMLIYFFLFATGVANILQHYKFAVPPTSDYGVFILYNAVQAFLLSNHLSGRAMVDQQLHMMLGSLNLVVIVCVALEIIYNRSVTAAIVKNLMMITQGVLLWEIGFIIFPYSFMHKFDKEDPVLKHIVNALGVLGIAIALMIALTMNFIISKRVEKMNLADVNRVVSLTHCQRISSGSKGDVESPLISDSD